MNVNKYMRLIGAALFVLVAGVSLEGCALQNYRTLAKSDAAAQALIEKKLNGAKSLDEAAIAMKQLGFSVTPRRPVMFGEGAEQAASAGYIECSNVVSDNTGSGSVTVDADIHMSAEGVAVVRRLERHTSKF